MEEKKADPEFEYMNCKKGLEGVFFKNPCYRVITHSNSSLAINITQTEPHDLMNVGLL